MDEREELSRLADFLLEHFPLDVSEGEKPVDVAIRLLKRLRTQEVIQRAGQAVFSNGASIRT